MSETVMFYGVMKSWMWGVYPVIKETDGTLTFTTEGIKSRRVKKTVPLFRFDTQAAAEAALAELKLLDATHATERSNLRLRQINDIMAMAEKLGASA